MATIFATLLYSAGCALANKRAIRLNKEIIQSGKTFDAAIVPGIPFNGGRWDRVMKGRVLWSYILYEKKIIRNVIYSGGAVYTPYYEAKIMGLYAQQLGIPAEHIFYDTLAEHSTENVFYSYEIAREQGFKTLVITTDPGQSALLNGFTRKKFKTPIAHLPFLADTLVKYEHLEPLIDPISAIKENFVPITQREGYWKRFKGTLGKNIPWKNKEKRADAL